MKEVRLVHTKHYIHYVLSSFVKKYSEFYLGHSHQRRQKHVSGKDKGATEEALKSLRVGTFNVNKTVGVMEHLDDMGCDICLVQDTFLSAKLREIKDCGWNIVSAPRKHRGGGGIGHWCSVQTNYSIKNQ